MAVLFWCSRGPTTRKTSDDVRGRQHCGSVKSSFARQSKERAAIPANKTGP